MDLEIYDYDGVGYNPTMHFDAWRVAFLNYAERFDKIEQLERHLLTDEVFVLLQGTATLFIGEDGKRVELEKNKIYNVKKCVWHNVRVSKDAKLIVVENDNTSKGNTEYMSF